MLFKKKCRTFFKNKIESELGDVEGILEAKVDLENKSGKFKYDSASKVTPDSIVKTIKDLGFTAKLVTNLFEFN